MIVVGRDDRFLAVAQVDHARMCGQLARAWGNERFGAVEPLEVVSLAAKEHELGMLEWDRAPALDTATGLPYGVKDLDLAVHLPLQVSGPRVLAEHDPYAGLLASLKHASMYAQPSRVGLVRRKRRQIRWFLDESRTLQAELGARVGAPDEDSRLVLSCAFTANRSTSAPWPATRPAASSSPRSCAIRPASSSETAARGRAPSGAAGSRPGRPGTPAAGATAPGSRCARAR